MLTFMALPSNCQNPVQIRFLLGLGNYTGRLWKRPRKAAHATGLDNHKDGGYTKVLKGYLNYLYEDGPNVNLEMARLAIDIYARLNVASHAKAEDPSIARNSRD